MYGQMVLWKKKKKIEVCLNPDFYLMHSHIYDISQHLYWCEAHIANFRCILPISM